MLFSSPSLCKMVKEAPNRVPMNMIGLAQTSREILEDVDVPIFLVGLSTPDTIQLSLNHHWGCTFISLSTFCVGVNKIFI